MVYCDIFLFSIGEIIAIIAKYMIIKKNNLDKSKVKGPK